MLTRSNQQKAISNWILMDIGSYVLLTSPVLHADDHNVGIASENVYHRIHLSEAAYEYLSAQQV